MEYDEGVFRALKFGPGIFWLSLEPEVFNTQTQLFSWILILTSFDYLCHFDSRVTPPPPHPCHNWIWLVQEAIIIGSWLVISTGHREEIFQPFFRC